MMKKLVISAIIATLLTGCTANPDRPEITREEVDTNVETPSFITE